MITTLIFLFLLFILFLKKNNNKQNNFSQENTSSLRGGGCLFIVFVHVINMTLQQIPIITNSEIWTNISNFFAEGFVGVFFLLSGYSLTIQYKKKNEKYLKKILLNKVPKLFLILIFTNLIYFLIFHINDKSSLQTIFIQIFGLWWSDGAYNKNSWFISPLIIFYLCFCLLLLIFKNKQKYAFIGIVLVPFIWIILITVLINLCDLNDHCWLYIRSVHCFSIGILYALAKRKIDNLLSSYGKYIFIFSIFIFALSLKWFITFLVPLFFVFDTIYLSLLFVNKNKIFNFLGKISLWIYLLHQIFISLFGGLVAYSQELFSLLVYLCAISSATIFYLFKNFIRNVLIKKIFNKNMKRAN